MSGGGVVVFLAALVACLVLAAWQWLRIVFAVYRWSCEQLGASPNTRPKDSRRSVSQGPQGRPPEGVDERVAGVYVLTVPLLAAAEAPDFDAFFGGLEAALAAGGVLVICLVVVLAVRRLTSF